MLFTLDTGKALKVIQHHVTTVVLQLLISIGVKIPLRYDQWRGESEAAGEAA